MDYFMFYKAQVVQAIKDTVMDTKLGWIRNGYWILGKRPLEMQRWWEDDVQAALKRVACVDVKCIKLA
jgi:hypothetical protein